MPIPPNWSEQLRIFVERWKQSSGAEEYLGDQPFPNFVLTERADSWDDFLNWKNELQGSWCFRGQREAGWSLLTSLDRDVRREFSTKYPNGIVVTGFYHDDRDEEGRKHLRKFQEEASLLAPKTPVEGDSGSWFALMQHYGTPTRFLDWTTSPFVAAYFAFEKEAQEDDKRSAIWAIDLDWLEKRGQELLQAKGWILTADNPEDRARWENRLLAECQEAVIIKMNPLHPNDRMAAQEGILLCKLLHAAFFSQTLMRMMIYPAIVQQPVVRKLAIDTSHRAEFLERLRAMNIHRASLFPDDFQAARA